MPKPPTLDDLRRYAVARTLFKPTTLARAIDKLGFVQADPIRAPARAQDLILRHRVAGYRAGDLERRYAKLGVEEDFFLTYGFVTRSLQSLMHPRSESGVPADSPARWPAKRRRRARRLLEFVREHGEVHPREVDAHFSHGTVRNYWGGSSSATTHLLDAMHYRGMLRVARRENGIRIYAIAPQRDGLPAGATGRRERIDALVDAA
ncbi:MAG TPA: crosslink repair DNA glycosylase YcaQ family protein, partial [Caldimonas sp.]|nr:crosslink repair DNA glycosylase YcaQ family protein [Caldimonas sp.]